MRLADLDMDGPGDSHSDKLRSDLHIAQALQLWSLFTTSRQLLIVVVFTERDEFTFSHLEKEFILVMGLDRPGTASEKPESLIFTSRFSLSPRNTVKCFFVICFK